MNNKQKKVLLCKSFYIYKLEFYIPDELNRVSDVNYKLLIQES